MRGPVWILGDAHGGGNAEGDAALLRLVRQARRLERDLLIMGDLFVAWLGPPRFWTSFQQQLLEDLRSLRQTGARVELVVGNRDYLAQTLTGDVFDAVHGGPVLLDLAGTPTWLLHGDGLVAADGFYRAWRAISRSAAVEALLHRLPGPTGQRLASDLEARLAKTNQRYKTGVLPLPELLAVGREALARGAARAITGHFHHDRVVDAAVPVYVAPGWQEHRRILEATSDGRLVSWDPLGD